jgi:hypothetical protein
MSSIQSVIFRNYTKQEAERWLNKYNLKSIKDPSIYKNDGFIYARRYRLHAPEIYKSFKSKKINDKITFIIGYF